MKHRFGVYVNADAQLILTALLKQLRGIVRLTAQDFEYPHKAVSVLQRITYSPDYRVALRLLMHDGYKSLTGGDPGRHRKLRMLGGGVTTTRLPIPSSAVGYVFGLNSDMDYRMTLAALLRRLNGNVLLRESDFPEQMGVGTTLFSVSPPPHPPMVLQLEKDRGNVALITPRDIHGSSLVCAGGLGQRYLIGGATNG